MTASLFLPLVVPALSIVAQQNKSHTQEVSEKRQLRGLGAAFSAGFAQQDMGQCHCNDHNQWMVMAKISAFNDAVCQYDEAQQQLNTDHREIDNIDDAVQLTRGFFWPQNTTMILKNRWRQIASPGASYGRVW
jgi:hypothetical protein